MSERERERRGEGRALRGVAAKRGKDDLVRIDRWFPHREIARQKNKGR